ncbi:hydrogenase subunit MbhD domain-containing protein [Millisia brevis]|uniref:hydrogenase subunit MbhD domain-containing protein n=1 Tax=Millisia brevis TaxID=264148 RepID=UPI0008366540|nr:hydrogenase subunit MbhD domain-containing protein [Millisia brevis]
MSAAELFDVVLVVGLVGTAGLALAHPRRTGRVVFFLIFGVLLAVLWARLRAPDIALVEAVIGTGITGALLIDAVHRRASAEAASRRGWGRRFAVAAGGVLGAAFAAVLVTAVRMMPEPTNTMGRRALDAVPDSGVDYPVTAVLLNFRAYDTLLEIAVLVAALFAVLAVQPFGWRPTDPDADPSRTNLALDGLLRMAVPLGVLLVGWVLVAGTSRPGGAFQAGALFAAGLIVLHLNGWARVVPRRRLFWPSVLLGLVVFTLVAVGTAALGGGWLVLEPPAAGTVILLIEVALTISIAYALVHLFLASRPAADAAPAAAEQPESPTG